MAASSIDRFIKFLLAECEDTDTTAFVDDLLGKAKAQITAGKGSVGFLQSVSANGKTVNRADKLTADEMAYACRQALRLYKDVPGAGPIVFLDFSGAPRIPDLPLP